jgi:hypothetical protein
MLFDRETKTVSVKSDVRTDDAGKVVLGAGFRLPSNVADSGRIRLGAGFRLPANVADSGRIRLGAGFRLPVRSV